MWIGAVSTCVCVCVSAGIVYCQTFFFLAFRTDLLSSLLVKSGLKCFYLYKELILSSLYPDESYQTNAQLVFGFNSPVPKEKKNEVLSFYIFTNHTYIYYVSDVVYHAILRS